MMNVYLILFVLSLCFPLQEKFAPLRIKMVEEQIEARGITHPEVLEAMRNVPRHLFVEESYQYLAYSDQALPISYNQTISQPYIVGFMTEAIDPRPGDKILEIGTGSGYQAAVLAQIVDEVYSVEIIPRLAEEAKELMSRLKYKNVHIKAGDGFYGWKEHAPYDAIIVTAAAEEIPPLLIEQLKVGGKMVIPVGPTFSVQNLMLVTKKDNSLKKENLLPVRFVPFTREEKK